METVILVIHLLIAFALIALIMLQKSEGGAMGGGLTGGASITGMTQSRVKGSPITRTTTILGVAFFSTSLILALMAKPQDATRSLFEVEQNGPASIPSVDPILPDAGQAPSEPSAPTVPNDE